MRSLIVWLGIWWWLSACATDPLKRAPCDGKLVPINSPVEDATDEH